MNTKLPSENTAELSAAKKLSRGGTTVPRYCRTSSGWLRTASEKELKITPVFCNSARKVVPTETESKQTLDAFVAALKEILDEAHANPEMVKTAPHTMPVRRLDDVKAARELDLVWKKA
mgnify:CR=1 FL=1